MTRLRDALPEASIRRLHDAGLSVDLAQHWLDHNATDGCTFGPDLFLPACDVHDYMCRTCIVPRYVADDIAYGIISDLIDVSKDEWVWRGMARVYSWLFWGGVTFGGILGIGAKGARA